MTLRASYVAPVESECLLAPLADFCRAMWCVLRLSGIGGCMRAARGSGRITRMATRRSAGCVALPVRFVGSGGDLGHSGSNLRCGLKDHRCLFQGPGVVRLAHQVARSLLRHALFAAGFRLEPRAGTLFQTRSALRTAAFSNQQAGIDAVAVGSRTASRRGERHDDTTRQDVGVASCEAERTKARQQDCHSMRHDLRRGCRPRARSDLAGNVAHGSGWADGRGPRFTPRVWSRGLLPIVLPFTRKSR